MVAVKYGMAMALEYNRGADHLEYGLLDAFRVERQPNIFKYLKDSDREKVLGRACLVTVPEGNTLFCQGDDHHGIFIIETGLMRTFYTSPAGREITLAYWQPGNFVGGPDIFGDGIHMWSGVAALDSTVLSLRGKDIRQLMLSMPELGLGIVEGLVFKGRCFSSLVQMLGTRSIPERLSQLLLILVDLHGTPDPQGGIAIAPQFTHEDLARMVGASRQWVTTTLDRLKARKIVKIRKYQIVVLRPDLLGDSMN